MEVHLSNEVYNLHKHRTGNILWQHRLGTLWEEAVDNAQEFILCVCMLLAFYSHHVDPEREN